MARALFEKTGNAVFISHLDLMRLFQRAFKRAGLNLKHTQGFNPRPSVSIALPLSVGVESYCELLDFDLEGEIPAPGEICDRLNNALVEGVSVRCVYEGGRKLKDLALLSTVVTMEYDNGITEDARREMLSLFRRETLPVEKKGKNGVAEQDLIPMIRELNVSMPNEHTLNIQALICCQNPTLNPMQLVAAVERYLPRYAPSFAKCTRLEVFDAGEKIFR